MLRLVVRLELFDEDQAAGMLTWPPAEFHVHTAVWVPEDDRAFATRLARDCARIPVALKRLTYDRTARAVTYRSEKSESPTADSETSDPLEFLARVLVHIPDTGHVTTRYDGWYAHRPRSPSWTGCPVRRPRHHFSHQVGSRYILPRPRSKFRLKTDPDSGLVDLHRLSGHVTTPLRKAAHACAAQDAGIR